MWLFYNFNFERNYDVLKSKSPYISLNKNINFKDTHREKVLLNKTPALTKSTYMGIWVVGKSNQLFIRGS